MPTDITIPAIGESITEGILARWLVADGDWVEEGAPLYELETDKVSSEINAEVSGQVQRLSEEGATVEVGASIGRIDESANRPESSTSSTATDEELRATDEDSTEQTDGSPSDDAGSGDDAHDRDERSTSGADRPPTENRSDEQDQADQSAERPSAAGGPPSPAARRLIDEHQLEVDSIRGSGRHGGITKGDVLGHLQQQGRAQPAVNAPRPQIKQPDDRRPPATDGSQRKRLSPLRKAIAQRLVNAQRTAAILSTFNEVDMTACRDLRQRFKQDFADKHGTGLGYMSFFTRAVVAALADYPLINSRIDGDEIVTPVHADIGIAVGTERGLVVPVLRQAETMGFADIERGIRDFAAKARDGRLTIDDMEGGTFTITNGGVYGSLLSTPIINPPQSGILGMHGIKDRPVAIDGEVVIRPMMYIALSYDHRIVDGAEAVGFLARIKELIEAPERFLFAL